MEKSFSQCPARRRGLGRWCSLVLLLAAAAVAATSLGAELRWPWLCSRGSMREQGWVLGRAGTAWVGCLSCRLEYCSCWG